MRISRSAVLNLLCLLFFLHAVPDVEAQRGRGGGRGGGGRSWGGGGRGGGGRGWGGGGGGRRGGGGGGGGGFSRQRTRSAPTVRINRQRSSPVVRLNRQRSNPVARVNRQRSAPVVTANALGNSLGRRGSRGGRIAGNLGNRSVLARLPRSVWRGWNRGRINRWGGYRWQWNGLAWVILGSLAYSSYYDDGYYNAYYDPSYAGYPDDYALAPDPGIAPPPPALAASVPSEVAVDDLQSALARAGYDPGPIDGDMGQDTRDAIVAFKNDHGMPATPVISTDLVAALGLQ